jgi:large subunit ribosomal protein L29
MEATEIRAMSVDELQEALETARQNLFNLRFQWATGQIRDHNVLKTARRDIARLETIQREREILAPEALAGEEEEYAR